MSTETPKAPCAHCRMEIPVPPQYAHGDHIKCGSCGTKHKVSRGDALRLVLADIGPLQEALEANRQRINRLEAELRAAQGSYGIGTSGLGFAVAYLLYQVAINEQTWSMSLLWKAVGVAVLTGVLLEAANFFFLAKRQTMTRISADIEDEKAEGARLRQQIRESSRF